MSDMTFTRSLGFAPETLDAHARTIEVTALSGLAPAVRPAPAPDGARSAWVEELDAAGADLSRLIGGPALRDHKPTTDSAVGVVASARIDGERIVASVRFDGSASATELIDKVSAGSVRGVSLGYRVNRFVPAGRRNGLPVFRAAAWVPHELSFTPVPVDAGATVRSEGATMPDNVTTETPPAPTEQTAAPLNRAAVNAEIRSIARLSGLPQSWTDAQIDADVTADAARAAAFAEMQKRSGPALNTTTVQVIHDNSDPVLVRSAMSDALAARLAPAHAKVEGRAVEYAGWSVLDMAAELARTRGDRLDARNRAAVVDAIFTRSAHSTSDFPLLLQDATNKAMLPGYTAAAPTYRQWSTQRSFNDFRPHRFLRLGDFPGLKEIGAEGGEPEYGSISENREVVTPKEFGTGISIGRRALMNDDLGALSSLTGLIGVRIAAEENRLMYGMLLSNPRLADGKDLFHAAHGNLPNAAAINVNSIAVVVSAMRKQTSLDGVVLNIAPRYLVVGPDKELEARQLLAAIMANQTSATNPWSGLMELVIDANITGNQWFVFADPGLYPVFVHGYVAGTTGPTVRSEIDFDTRALKIAVGLDFGFGAIDFRGAVFNEGA